DQIDWIPRSLQQLDALGNRLDHAELDPVVDELREMPGARRADVVSALRIDREITENWVDRVVGGSIAAGHEARTTSGATHPATRAQIEEFDPGFAKPGVSANRIGPVRVSPVGDDIARTQQWS